MINPEAYWNEQFRRVPFTKIEHINFPTLVGRVSSDGRIDYSERKIEPSSLVAGDYSVQSLLQTAPELLKPTPLLDFDPVRSMDSVEYGLSELQNQLSNSSEVEEIIP